MTLEQAGVELIAKNYRAYMKQLRDIDKEQQRLFRDPGRGIDQAHSRAANAARNHENRVKALNQVYKKLGTIAAGVLSIRTLQEAQELAEEALDFRRLSAQFQNLAASSNQSANEIVDAMRRASQGALTNAEIVDDALAIMRLEVAATPAEIEEFVRLGVALRPAYKSAADAVDELTVALGRKTLRVLDNFNVNSDRANREMERMAQQRFGVAFDELDDAAQSAVFMEGAINALRDDFEKMGGDTIEIASDLDRAEVAAKNLRLVVGEALVPGAEDLGGALATVLDTLAQIVALSASWGAGINATVDVLSRGTSGLLELIAAGPVGLGKVAGGITAGTIQGENIGDIFREAVAAGQEAQTERLKDMLQAMGIFTDETEAAAGAQDTLGDSVEDTNNALKAQQDAVDQAARIQRNYIRAQETALRKAQRQAEKLQRQQAKDYAKLEKDLQDDLADLAQDGVADRAKIEADGAKEILRAQQNLNRQLRQEQERYQLSQLQSKRRFNLQDKRLRAEGDILALQQLREDYELQQKEEQENFDLSQRQQQESGQAQIQQQEEDQREQLRELQADIENRRAEILSSYDEELAELQAKHAEQREEQARSLAEQLEDLRRNRAQQLEDLGYHLAQQEDITRQGAQNVADELEKVFGVDGVADQIMAGYTERTESRFTELFRNLEQAVTTGNVTYNPAGYGVPQQAPTTIGMQHGFSGVVTGPQPFMVEPGVTEFVYAAPVRGGGGAHDILELAGGAEFSITGAEGASPGMVDAALNEIVGDFRSAVRLLVRRG